MKLYRSNTARSPHDWFDRKDEFIFDHYINELPHDMPIGSGYVAVDGAMIYSWRHFFWLPIFNKNELVYKQGRVHVIEERNSILGVTLNRKGTTSKILHAGARNLKRIQFEDLSPDDKEWVVLYWLDNS